MAQRRATRARQPRAAAAAIPPGAELAAAAQANAQAAQAVADAAQAQQAIAQMMQHMMQQMAPAMQAAMQQAAQAPPVAGAAAAAAPGAAAAPAAVAAVNLINVVTQAPWFLNLQPADAILVRNAAQATVATPWFQALQVHASPLLLGMWGSDWLHRLPPDVQQFQLTQGANLANREWFQRLPVATQVELLPDLLRHHMIELGLAHGRTGIAGQMLSFNPQAQAPALAGVPRNQR